MEIKSSVVKKLGAPTYEKLIKMLKNRGFSPCDFNSITDMKLAIAYAEGYNIGKSEAMQKLKENKSKTSAEKTSLVCICDIEHSQSFEIVETTPSALKLLEFLRKNDYLKDEIEFSKLNEIKTTKIL